MGKTFDIGELRNQVGSDGNRNRVDTAETSRIIRDFDLFKKGDSTLAMTPSGGVVATNSESFKKFEETNPELAGVMPQLGSEFRSF